MIGATSFELLRLPLSQRYFAAPEALISGACKLLSDDTPAKSLRSRYE